MSKLKKVSSGERTTRCTLVERECLCGCGWFPSAVVLPGGERKELSTGGNLRLYRERKCLQRVRKRAQRGSHS